MPTKLRPFLGALAAVAGLFVATAPDASAFSAFKSRFGGTHPMCKLEPGTQIWPTEDISVVPARATNGVPCPAPAMVTYCKNVGEFDADYGLCKSILKKDSDCRKPPRTNLGTRSDKQFWAGFATYKPVVSNSFYDLGHLGTLDVPVDIEVRFHFITEVDPHYEFAAPGFKIGGDTITAPPYTGQAKKDPRSYWGGWHHDCGSCHTPHRYARGPIHYWFGDNLERHLRRDGGSPRTREAYKMSRGTYDIRGSVRCYPRDKNGCGSHAVYQQRMRIEFLRCQ